MASLNQQIFKNSCPGRGNWANMGNKNQLSLKHQNRNCSSNVCLMFRSQSITFSKTIYSWKNSFSSEWTQRAVSASVWHFLANRIATCTLRPYQNNNGEKPNEISQCKSTAKAYPSHAAFTANEQHEYGSNFPLFAKKLVRRWRKHIYLVRHRLCIPTNYKSFRILTYK